MALVMATVFVMVMSTNPRVMYVRWIPAITVSEFRVLSVQLQRTVYATQGTAARTEARVREAVAT